MLKCVVHKLLLKNVHHMPSTKWLHIFTLFLLKYIYGTSIKVLLCFSRVTFCLIVRNVTFLKGCIYFDPFPLKDTYLLFNCILFNAKILTYLVGLCSSCSHKLIMHFESKLPTKNCNLNPDLLRDFTC